MIIWRSFSCGTAKSRPICGSAGSMMSIASALSAISIAVNATNSHSGKRRVGGDETDWEVESGDTG